MYDGQGPTCFLQLFQFMLLFQLECLACRNECHNNVKVCNPSNTPLVVTVSQSELPYAIYLEMETSPIWTDWLTSSLTAVIWPASVRSNLWPDLYHEKQSATTSHQLRRTIQLTQSETAVNGCLTSFTHQWSTTILPNLFLHTCDTDMKAAQTNNTLCHIVLGYTYAQSFCTKWSTYVKCPYLLCKK